MVKKVKSLSVENYEIYAITGGVLHFGINLFIDKLIVELTPVQAMVLANVLSSHVEQMKERFGIL